MKKLRLIHYVLLILIGISTSSCFDILEEYEFNADGSGRVRYTVDVSKLVDLMGSLSEMDSTGESGNKMDEMFTENNNVQILKSIPGISNVMDLNDKDTKIIGYSYAFESVEALNNTLAIEGSENEMMSAMGMSTDGEGKENFVSLKGKKFKRTLNFPESGEEEDKAEGEEAQYEEMAKMMFADAKYRVKYTFAQGVKKVKKNDAAILGPNKKSVTIECSMLDLMDHKANLSSEIILK
jgi:hypothetical protein